MKDSNKQLITHIVTHYKKYFEPLSYSNVFSSLQMAYEEMQENVQGTEGISIR